MALLSYNSHTIQFTRLKYTIQWLSAYTQDWATSATISFKIFSLPPKEVSYLLTVTPKSFYSLPHLSRRQPLTHFLFLWIGLFGTFHEIKSYNMWSSVTDLPTKSHTVIARPR